jgi:hypothetical protein
VPVPAGISSFAGQQALHNAATETMTEHSDASQISDDLVLTAAGSSNEQQSQRNKKLLSRQVARYLIQNPGFFAEHLELLETIQLP